MPRKSRNNNNMIICIVLCVIVVGIIICFVTTNPQNGVPQNGVDLRSLLWGGREAFTSLAAGAIDNVGSINP